MFDHEKLDVYRVSLDFVTWSYQLCESLRSSHRNARDQLLRAFQSIPLNIAEDNGKLPSADRQRFLRIALGSSMLTKMSPLSMQTRKKTEYAYENEYEYDK